MVEVRKPESKKAVTPKTLEQKLDSLQKQRDGKAFILADAKDADMAFGIASPGGTPGKWRSMSDLRDQIREIVAQGLVDIMLMSARTSELLTIQERIFDSSTVTPAVRANDATDVHIIRGGRYTHSPSQPFSTATIDQLQSGRNLCSEQDRKLGASLGLYSVTFNNLPDSDLQTLELYKAFRLEAEEKGFRHFLEVFAPNVSPDTHGLTNSQIPGFINDHIARMLAGVCSAGRPLFLKIPYLGARAMEELCHYDSSMPVGVLGGSAGTTHDAFALLNNAKRHGARVALFGRKIKAADHQLTFVRFLRMVADDEIAPEEAVKAYHGELERMKIVPSRSLEADLEITDQTVSYDS